MGRAAAAAALLLGTAAVASAQGTGAWLHVRVDEDLPVREGHAIAEAVRHALFHALPRLAVIMVHVDPSGTSGTDHHHITAHHAAEA